MSERSDTLRRIIHTLAAEGLEGVGISEQLLRCGLDVKEDEDVKHGLAAICAVHAAMISEEGLGYSLSSLVMHALMLGYMLANEDALELAGMVPDTPGALG